MAAEMVIQSPSGSVGTLLKQWRERRRISQLTLSLEAEISSRHLSFVETGRSHPSREMVLRLAKVLDVPPRARNDLLSAAGYAPIYRESNLDAPEMAQFRQALDFMLRQQEPYPAIVLDRYWNILLANEGAGRFTGLFLEPSGTDLGVPNAMRLIFHPQALRPYIVNWEATAAALAAASGKRPATVDVKLWVKMLRAAGMNEDDMHRWHSEFERRAPDGHQEFLLSLGLSPHDAEEARRLSREEWTPQLCKRHQN